MNNDTGFVLKAPIYKFFEEQDSENKFKCKSCLKFVTAFGSTSSNLIKHINTTNEAKHLMARNQLKEMSKDSPYANRDSKRKRLEMDALKTPNKNLIEMGACTPKAKFLYNNPRQIDW